MYSVFLVDDEELIVKQIADTVPWMDNGFEVIGTETNPARAGERILDLNPDVVFTDLRMPNTDGHSLMHFLKEKGMDTEFVMISAFGTFEDARTFFQQEGFDYLLKPIQLEEVQLVLEKLAKKLADKYPIGYNPGNETMNAAFVELVDYVRENYSKKFTLEQLAKKFGLSAGYICNLFAKHYNTTLTCFVTKVRMEHAVSLIEENRQTLKSIAYECGYKDYFYFNKVFKGYYGIAPSQYLSDGRKNTSDKRSAGMPDDL